MKKEDVSGIIVYLLILVIAVVFGLTILQEHAGNSGLGTVEYVFFVLGGIATGLLLNSIVFEFAHVLGAKAGRYKVLSLNILGFMWYKDEGKTRFKFSGFDGLTGETKIYPREDVEKEPNPSPYLLFGTLFYVVELIAIVVAFILLNAKGGTVLVNIAYFLLIVGVIGGMIIIYNILPFKLDATTDGYRLRMCTNAANKKAFNELLRVEHAISEGRTDVEISTFSDITNFTADLNLNKVYILLEKHEYKEAEELIDIILAGKENISEKVYTRARAQKIYINIYTKSLEEAKQFYDAEVPMPERRLISNDLSMVSIRTYLLMSGLLDGSKSECLLAINNVKKCFDRTPKQRQKTEADLFNNALTKIDELHPTWKLEEYHIVFEEKKKKEKEKTKDE